MAARAVFFDFGGTLVQAFREAYPTYAAVLGAHGIEVSRERWGEVNHRVGDRLESLRYQLVRQTPSWGDRMDAETLRELGIPDPGGTLSTELHDAFTAPESHRPYPESRGVIESLRRDGLSVHLVSNNVDWLLETVSRLDWTDLFDSVTFSQEAGAEKPDPRVFELALRRAGCEPLDRTYVGDTWEADYLGAKRTGLRAIWLNRDGVRPPEPCEMIRDLRELPPLLNP